MAPVEAVGELFDHAAGTHIADSVANLAGKPEATDGKLAWAASQLGSAVGMTPWMWLLHKGASAGLQSLTGVESLSAMQRIGVSGTAGMLYGMALTPTGSGDRNWGIHRLENGIATGLSFGTLTAGAQWLGARGITNRAVAGVISGIPAGLVDTESRYAMGQSQNANPFPTMLGYSFVGGVFGLMPPFGRAAVSDGVSNGGSNVKPDVQPDSPARSQETQETAAVLDTTRESAPVRDAPVIKDVLGYTGYFLTPDAAQKAGPGLTIDGKTMPLRWNPPDQMHVTEEFGIKASSGEAWLQTAKADSPALKVVGYAVDNTGVEALVVSVDGQTKRPDGEHYHVTRSLAEGRRAVESVATIDSALTVEQARAQGRLADIAPEVAQRYAYTALQPSDQFALSVEPRFHESETAAKMERLKPAPRPEVRFEAMSARGQVISALKNTPPEYLTRTIQTRTPEHRAGSYFDMTANDLREELFKAKWEPYNPLDAEGNAIISDGARGYRATIPGGRLGMVPVDTIADTAKLYLIDPKGTGKWSVSTIGATEPHTDVATMIVGPPDEPGGKNVVWTFHPGEPVPPSMLDSATLQSIFQDAGLSTEGLRESGFDRRIEITRAQLDQINAALPDQAKMTLAKIEAEQNLDH